MANPDATREYWHEYRKGRYDALLFGVIAMGNRNTREQVTPGYDAGVDSVRTLASKAKRNLENGGV